MAKNKLLYLSKIFGFASITTIVIVALVAYYLGFDAALITVFLIALEVSLSFDNAVVNAGILGRLSRFWQDLFLTVGIIIAVFGVRILLPIVIVSLAAMLPVSEVIELAVNEPDTYEHYLTKSHPIIAAFGGMFLLLVFLAFFMFENKKHHWLKSMEKTFEHLPNRWFTAPIIALSILIPISFTTHETYLVMVAGLVGIVVFILMHSLIHYMQKQHQIHAPAAKLAGFAGFMAFSYLNVLDASFSLDSVIGAFAITSSVILIAAGLGAGTVWVRSITVYLVRHQTLAKYMYLEQGAHYAIGVLALVLLSSFFIHIPEYVTGLAGIIIIILAVFSSRREALTKKENSAA